MQYEYYFRHVGGPDAAPGQREECQSSQDVARRAREAYRSADPEESILVAVRRISKSDTTEWEVFNTYGKFTWYVAAVEVVGQSKCCDAPIIKEGVGRRKYATCINCGERVK